MDGFEHYRINNNRFKLEANTYLAVNAGDELDIHVKSSNATNGVCIYPPYDLLQDVYNSQTQSEKSLLDLNTPQTKLNFTPKRYHLKETSVGAFLKNHIPYITSRSPFFTRNDFDNFYINLAECLVNDQIAVDAQLTKLRSTKKQTKEELYRRISLAQEFIHDNFIAKFEIAELAELACMSKYHFLRCFRDLYSCTPYQYVLKLKLEKAQSLFAKGYSYAQIADQVGFSDPRNLRKALNRKC